MSHPGATASDRHKVVIIGSGFGGLNAAQKLKRADVDIKLIAGPPTTCSSRCCTRWRPASSPRARSPRPPG